MNMKTLTKSVTWQPFQSISQRRRQSLSPGTIFPPNGGTGRSQIERETRVTESISDLQDPQHKTKKTKGRSVGYSLLLGHSRPAVRSTASPGRSPKRHTVGLPFGRMTTPIVPSGLPVSSWALV